MKSIGIISIFLLLLSKGVAQKNFTIEKNNFLLNGKPTSPNICSKYLSLAKCRAAVTGERDSNATPDTKP